jgi:hypothetical protein
MDATELRRRAMHYRRLAELVTDEAAQNAMLELVAEYESLADRMDKSEPTPGATQQ